MGRNEFCAVDALKKLRPTIYVVSLPNLLGIQAAVVPSNACA